MSASLGKVLKYAGMLGIGVLLLTLAMRGVDDPQALWDDMRSASGWSIGASFVMGYLAIVSRGMRWLILLEPLGHQPKMQQHPCGGLQLLLQRLRSPERGTGPVWGAQSDG